MSQCAAPSDGIGSREGSTITIVVSEAESDRLAGSSLSRKVLVG